MWCGHCDLRGLQRACSRVNAPAGPNRAFNVTDPDARNRKTPRGWVQGYNAQAAVTVEQMVIAAEISTESLDTGNLHPMLIAAEQEPDAAGVTEALGIVVADAGDSKTSAIEALAGEGLQTPRGPGRRSSQ